MNATIREPSEYSRRILLVVIGMTPQIVTETLYKLAVKAEPAFVPTEVHLITTLEGAKSAELALLGVEGGFGWFHQLCDDFSFSGIRFNKETIHVIADTEGQFIDDDQSTEHNRIASDFITGKVREFTRDDGNALHVSLAGGRKTMSYYAGYALSLYGRMQDRLSHVLVNEPFQNNKDFFYPRPKPERLEINNKYFSTDDANIILSDIPYVRMRYQVPELLLEGKDGFQETVDKIQRFSQPESIEFDLQKQSVAFNGVPVPMSNSEFAFYLWMCERKMAKEPPLVLEADDFMSEFLDVYRRFTSRDGGLYERAEKVAREKGISEQKSYFWSKKRTVHKRIEDRLGKRPAQIFLVQTLELVEYEEKKAYEISIAADAITQCGYPLKPEQSV